MNGKTKHQIRTRLVIALILGALVLIVFYFIQFQSLSGNNTISVAQYAVMIIFAYPAFSLCMFAYLIDWKLLFTPFIKSVKAIPGNIMTFIFRFFIAFLKECIHIYKVSIDGLIFLSKKD